MPANFRVGFHAGRCLPIHARSIEERPLGGTETALIRVAALLATRGHDVTVFTSLREPPPSVPRYLHADQLSRAGAFDVFISVMDWRPLFYGVSAKKNYFWTGDSFDQYANYGIGDLRVRSRIDRFLAVSDWHADSFCRETSFPREKAAVILNGVELAYFSGEEPRNNRRLIFSSAPYRGLVLVPPLFQKLKLTFPDLELHVFAGLAIYDTDKPFQGPELGQYQQLARALSRIPGVVVHGNVLQQQLAREFMRSALLFYPNVFVETSCISVLEALAGGCPVVTSARGALPETVGEGGITVAGEPGSHEYMKAFLEASSKLLADRALWEKMSSAGKAKVHAEYGWEKVADRFEDIVRADLPINN